MAIGQKLEDARNRKGISIREASESTKIRGDFLTSFESGNFDINLPEVYLRGFIRVYARFLGIDPESAVADLNHEIGSAKNKNAKKPIGKIGGTETTESSKEISSIDSTRTSAKRISTPNSSRAPLIFIGIIGSVAVLLSIILIIVFSSDDISNDQITQNEEVLQQSVRETKSNSQKFDNSNEKPLDSIGVEERSESFLKLAAIGPIERLIISDEGKSPKVFHEFKNLQTGWEKSIPFSEGFRCYSSSLQYIRFAIDDGVEKQVSGEGAGNFSWSKK